MFRPKLVAPAAALAGVGMSAAAVLFVFAQPPSPAQPSPEAPAFWRPPADAPLRPVPVMAAPVEAVEEDAPEAPVACQPATAHEPLTEALVLSYYGNPYTADMGILGELPPLELVQQLTEHAQRYDDLNGPRPVQPALHLVYATAQPDPGDDGLYLLYVDDGTLREYVQLACDHGLLIFLDLQIGRSDVSTELAKVLTYLQKPHVHLALDPEFAMPDGELPGEAIGSLDAADVNAAQRALQQLVDEHDLPDKVLVVHQFVRSMLTRPDLLEDHPRVRLVIDMDGFGPAEIKRVKYGWFAAPAEHAGIKLFFRQDPDLMSEEDVLELEPDLIIYQ